MSEIPIKPYLMRAIHEWCNNSGYTPYMVVKVDAGTRVPMEFVRNGEITLNVSYGATKGLKMDDEIVYFSARFNGVARDIIVPIDNVIAIMSAETRQGMVFEQEGPVLVHPQPSGTEAQESHGHHQPPSPPTLSVVPPPTAPILSVVPPLTDAARAASQPPEGEGDRPDPPKNGGRPTLTRVK